MKIVCLFKINCVDTDEMPHNFITASLPLKFIFLTLFILETLKRYYGILETLNGYHGILEIPNGYFGKQDLDECDISSRSCDISSRSCDVSSRSCGISSRSCFKHLDEMSHSSRSCLPKYLYTGFKYKKS